MLGLCVIDRLQKQEDRRALVILQALFEISDLVEDDVEVFERSPPLLSEHCTLVTAGEVPEELFAVMQRRTHEVEARFQQEYMLISELIDLQRLLALRQGSCLAEMPGHLLGSSAGTPYLDLNTVTRGRLVRHEFFGSPFTIELALILRSPSREDADQRGGGAESRRNRCEQRGFNEGLHVDGLPDAKPDKPEREAAPACLKDSKRARGCVTRAGLTCMSRLHRSRGVSDARV
jgi:hypothetical protein